MTRHPTRRQFRQAGAATAAAACLGPFAGSEESPQGSMSAVCGKTLRFIESLRVADGAYGRYRYAAGCRQPTLYSSTYAAMTRHLYRDLDQLTESQCVEWVGYLLAHQDDDGLFRDPVIFDQGWYKGDPEWCGWFVHGKGFTYGHEQLAASATQGAMFPTWFRTLTLAYLGKALPDSVVGQCDWQFCGCPGLQFWRT